MGLKLRSQSGVRPYRAAAQPAAPQGNFMLITAPAKINLYLGRA